MNISNFNYIIHLKNGLLGLEASATSRREHDQTTSAILVYPRRLQITPISTIMINHGHLLHNHSRRLTTLNRRQVSKLLHQLPLLELDKRQVVHGLFKAWIRSTPCQYCCCHAIATNSTCAVRVMRRLQLLLKWWRLIAESALRAHEWQVRLVLDTRAWRVVLEESIEHAVRDLAVLVASIGEVGACLAVVRVALSEAWAAAVFECRSAGTVQTRGCLIRLEWGRLLWFFRGGFGDLFRWRVVLLQGAVHCWVVVIGVGRWGGLVEFGEVLLDEWVCAASVGCVGAQVVWNVREAGLACLRKLQKVENLSIMSNRQESQSS